MITNLFSIVYVTVALFSQNPPVENPYWNTERGKNSRFTKVYYYISPNTMISTEEIPGKLDIRKSSVKRRLDQRLTIALQEYRAKAEESYFTVYTKP